MLHTIEWFRRVQEPHTYFIKSAIGLTYSRHLDIS